MNNQTALQDADLRTCHPNRWIWTHGQRAWAILPKYKKSTKTWRCPFASHGTPAFFINGVVVGCSTIWPVQSHRQRVGQQLIRPTWLDSSIIYDHEGLRFNKILNSANQQQTPMSTLSCVHTATMIGQHHRLDQTASGLLFFHQPHIKSRPLKSIQRT